MEHEAPKHQLSGSGGPGHLCMERMCDVKVPPTSHCPPCLLGLQRVRTKVGYDWCRHQSAPLTAHSGRLPALRSCSRRQKPDIWERDDRTVITEEHRGHWRLVWRCSTFGAPERVSVLGPMHIKLWVLTSSQESRSWEASESL